MEEEITRTLMLVGFIFVIIVMNQNPHKNPGMTLLFIAQLPLMIFSYNIYFEKRAIIKTFKY